MQEIILDYPILVLGQVIYESLFLRFIVLAVELICDLSSYKEELQTDMVSQDVDYSQFVSAD